MRINKYVASATDLSRRAADTAIGEGRVLINGVAPEVGQEVTTGDMVTLDGSAITPTVKTTIMLNKPPGYVCSRDGQGSQTIYDLLPPEYQHLNPVGRLDKNSSGLLLMTNDGAFAQDMSHPSREKQKVYQVVLATALQPLHRQMIQDHGIQLEDGLSKFQIERRGDGDDRDWQIIMHEGRNRQIRRTFQALDYEVLTLHRTQFGPFGLEELARGSLKIIS